MSSCSVGKNIRMFGDPRVGHIDATLGEHSLDVGSSERSGNRTACWMTMPGKRW
jgi:hypothetical protein